MINNKKGNGLIMAMFAVAAVAGLSYIVVQKGKLNSKISSKMTADKDIEMAVTKIASLMISPADCNANFYNADQTGSLTSIRKCTGGGNCRTTGTPVVEVPIISESSTADADWSATNTKLSNRVRLVGASYSKTTPQAKGPTTSRAAVLTLVLRLQKNLGSQTVDNSVGAAQSSRRQVNVVEKSVDVFVVTDTWSGGVNTPHPSGKIYGCAKSFSATTPY